MITEHDINRAYEALASATREYSAAGFEELTAKHALEVHKAHAIANGDIAGKNAEEREANARILLGNHYNDVAIAADKMLDARLALDLARLEVERVRALLRLAELVANGYELPI